MESYISHPDFGKSNFELFKTIKQETNNFQIDELLYLKKDLGNILNGYLSSHNQTRTSSEGSIKTDFSREINLIENKLQIINDELSRLEREKTKGNPKGGNDQQSGKNRVLAYNNNVKNAKRKIELILKDINNLIFENSTPDQWESIFNNQTPTIQIVVKPDVTFKDLRYFFDKLKDIGVFEVGYMKPLISLNAFYAKKSMCTLKHRQLIEGARSAKTAIPPLIDDINKLFDK